MDATTVVNDAFKAWVQTEMVEADYDVTRWCQDQVERKGEPAVRRGRRKRAG